MGWGEAGELAGAFGRGAAAGAHIAANEYSFGALDWAGKKTGLYDKLGMSSASEKICEYGSAGKWSRGLARLSRDLAIAAATPNLGQWLKNPKMYEIGSTTLPKPLFETIRGLNTINRGRLLTNLYGGGFRATFSTSWRSIPSTILTGGTPGARLFGRLGGAHAIDWWRDR